LAAFLKKVFREKIKTYKISLYVFENLKKVFREKIKTYKISLYVFEKRNLEKNLLFFLFSIQFLGIFAGDFKKNRDDRFSFFF